MFCFSGEQTEIRGKTRIMKRSMTEGPLHWGYRAAFTQAATFRNVSQLLAEVLI
jgi:hypothetical protein